MLQQESKKQRQSRGRREEFTRLFCAFTDAPEQQEQFLKAREEFVSLSTYHPYETGDFHRFSDYVFQGSYESAVMLDTTIMYSWMLSPEYHLIRHHLYVMLDDHERAQHARWLAELLLQALLATGDGTEETPYLVSSLSDIYAIIETICGGVTEYCVGQEVRVVEGRYIDRVAISEEYALYFDVSDMIASCCPSIAQGAQSQHSLEDLLSGFYSRGSKEDFLALRDQVIQIRKDKKLEVSEFVEFDPQEESLASLSVCVRRYLNQELPERALALLAATQEHFLVCPAYYRLQEFVYSYMGKQEERLIARAQEKTMLFGILGTGDGSIEQPFCVTRSDDVCMVLELFEEEITGEHCDFFRGNCYLCIMTHKGNTYYFDFTDVLELS